MQKNSGYIDLHIHTNNSDGWHSSKEIIKLAKENNTNFIAISDHDTINGLKEFENNLEEGMLGVLGVEFSSYIIHNYKKVNLHLLGYGFDKNNDKLNFILNEMKEKRLHAHLCLLKTLKENLINITEESISKIDIERYCWFDREIIKIMENDNYSQDIIDFYKNYFKKNKFTYGKDYNLNVNDVIDAIKSANGFVVLAHPMAYKLDRNEIMEIILKLSKLGLDGIEVYQSDCSFEDSLYLNNISKKYNLLNSVGSDFHRILNSDGREIGKGINSNLCLEETLLTNKILEKKRYIKGVK